MSSSSSCTGNCMELSEEEYDSLIAEGWTKLAGPYGTENECQDNCCASSSSSSGDDDCFFQCDQCPNGISKTWTVTVSGVTNDQCQECSSVNGTWIIRHFGNGCDFNTIESEQCLQSGPMIEMYYEPTGDEWILLLNSEAGYFIPAAEFNCYETNVFGNFSTPPGSEICTNYPTTLTVSPVGNPCSPPLPFFMTPAGGERSVRTFCCEEEIPTTLTLTITEMADCACLDGLTLPMTSDSPCPGYWSTDQIQFSCNGRDKFLRITLNCSEGNWGLSYACTSVTTPCVVNNIGALTKSCDPFQLEYINEFGGTDCCSPGGGGRINITITA